jgi:hypothetical protein
MALAFVLGSLLQWVLGLPFVRWDYRLLLRSWILGSAAQLILVSLGCLILAQSLDRDASSVMVVAGFSIAVLASVAAYAGILRAQALLGIGPAWWRWVTATVTTFMTVWAVLVLIPY